MWQDEIERKFKQGFIFGVMIFFFGLAVFGIFRYAVGTLWGSGSDLGVFLAPFAAIFGLMALVWLWVWFIKIIKKV